MDTSGSAAAVMTHVAKSYAVLTNIHDPVSVFCYSVIDHTYKQFLQCMIAGVDMHSILTFRLKRVLDKHDFEESIILHELGASHV